MTADPAKLDWVAAKAAKVAKVLRACSGFSGFSRGHGPICVLADGLAMDERSDNAPHLVAVLSVDPRCSRQPLQLTVLLKDSDKPSGRCRLSNLVGA
jgi:hypothetical protein